LQSDLHNNQQTYWLRKMWTENTGFPLCHVSHRILDDLRKWRTLYIYTHTYIYIYIHVCVYIYTHARTHTHIQVCVYIYIYTHTHTHTHTYIPIYMCV